MSSPDLNYHASTNTSLVGKILEQGLRLRNSMVQTILCNDPFSKDFLRSDGLRSVEEGGRKSGRSGFEFDETGILEDLGIVRGDSSRNKVYSIKNCSCDICREYNKAYGTVDGADVYRSTHPSLKNVPDDVSEIPQKVSTLSLIKSTFDENYSLLKYVDSLKVTVNFFKINTAGKRKLSDIDKTLYQSSVTFYIEYSLPEIVQRFLPKSKAKVNSGLQPKSKIRYCSKRLQNNSVLFKQSSVHLLSNIDKLDLSSINIDVTITCRTLKQKSAEPFGRSNFNLGAIITNPNLTVTQELPILGAKQPVVLGMLNVVLQFGCDKLHFGKEFIDAIGASRETNIVHESVSKLLDVSPKKKPPPVPVNTERSVVTPHVVKTVYEPETPRERERDDFEASVSLLHLFVFVPQGQLLGSNVDSYLICYGLHKDDIITSQIVYNSSNPAYNFYQSIPILYDENFLSHLEDKHIVVEVWEKTAAHDKIIGITRLSLHRFFVIYRNREVVRNLLKNQNPIVGIDWWEPIVNASRKNCGQLKSTVALGTETQINSFKNDLEFKQLQRNNTKTVETVVYDKYVQIPEDTNVIPAPSTVDAATQSMDSEIKLTNRDFLSNFMEQVLASKEVAQKNVYVENSTNTDAPGNGLTNEVANEPANEPVVRKTSDLLESLQKALSVGEVRSGEDEGIDSFKAHVVVDSALHLPSRRKCKSKRNRTKGGKNSEEILPSTYVTFKTDKDKDLVVTGVVPKSTSPQWSFRYDAVFPGDFLLNNQKRLIFKVWRRSSQTSLTPNFQTDVVLGFAALDLTVLLSGLPNIQGWFNIVDFSSKVNGQIKIHINPLENLSKFNKLRGYYTPEKLPTTIEPKLPEPDESPPELFSRALKRKFTELEEITQRLKQRLSTVTNDDSDISDDFADEFERDLNTECVETEKVNFEGILNTLELPHVSKSDDSRTITPPGKSPDFERNLKEGKLRIDSLLEKLSLITDDKSDNRIDNLLERVSQVPESETTFSNRYVSGCSIDRDTPLPESSRSLYNNPLLKQLNLDSASGINPDLIFNPLLFQQIFTGSNEPTPRSDDFKISTTLQDLIETSTSSSSVDSNRQEPDGAGGNDPKLK